MRPVQTGAQTIRRRALRKVRNYLIGFVALFVLATAGGLALYHGIVDGTQAAAETVTDAVTPDIDVVTPVVDMRDQAAELVDSLPPPSLIVQQARELVGAGDG